MFQETTKTAKGILDEATFYGSDDISGSLCFQEIEMKFVKEMMEHRRHAYLEDTAMRQNNYKIFKANELDEDEFENFADHHGFHDVTDDEDQMDAFRTYLTEEFERYRNICKI